MKFLVIFVIVASHRTSANGGLENFQHVLEQFEKDRSEGLLFQKHGSPIIENEGPLLDKAIWAQASLSKRSILVIKPDTIRLNLPDNLPKQNGTGRVEVYHNNQWGTVCDVSWDIRDAFVVCNELGLVKAIQETKKAKFGMGEGPVWLNRLGCTGKEKSLLACPHPGWGNVGNCNHGNDAGVRCLETGLPRVIEVGCYKDSQSNRTLRTLYGYLRSEIDWFNLRNMISKCAERAWQRRYRYFGIQFYGECWGDDEAETRYNIQGKVDPKDDKQNCIEGIGMHWANYVYKFAPWRDLGCWKDNTRDRAVPQLVVNLRYQIDWFNIAKTIDQCYQAAKTVGKEYFAVQYFGECWVADDESTYMKHGPSVECWSGVGKASTNYVYKVEW